MFTISYTIITPESAEYGDVDDQGIIDEGLTLRDAIKELFMTRTNAVDGISAIEASCYPLPRRGWLEFRPSCTVYNGMEFETGAQENRSIHPQGRITASSWARIVRLIKSI
jgi:hypothetical protein